MELSALLGGGDGAPDLGDALSSRTSKGDLVFSKPFGDATKWRTETGFVTATVVFDPFLPWSRENLLCSTTPNYIQNIRRRLGEHLVADDMVPQGETLEQLRWASIASALPNKTLDEYLQEKDPASEKGEKRLADYIRLLMKNVDAQYKEDTSLHTALSEKAFDFTYHLAVDMYPQDKDNKVATSSDATSRDKRGVLVFNIQGEVDIPLKSGKAKVGVDALDPSEEPQPAKAVKAAKVAKGKKAKTAAPVSEDDGSKDEAGKHPLRKHHSAVSKKYQKELEQLLDRLDLDEARLDASHCEWIKKFPKTADKFFDQLSSWFDALLQRKQAQLERDGEASGAQGLYL